MESVVNLQRKTNRMTNQLTIITTFDNCVLMYGVMRMEQMCFYARLNDSVVDRVSIKLVI